MAGAPFGRFADEQRRVLWLIYQAASQHPPLDGASTSSLGSSSEWRFARGEPRSREAHRWKGPSKLLCPRTMKRVNRGGGSRRKRVLFFVFLSVLFTWGVLTLLLGPKTNFLLSQPHTHEHSVLIVSAVSANRLAEGLEICLRVIHLSEPDCSFNTPEREDIASLRISSSTVAGEFKPEADPVDILVLSQDFVGPVCSSSGKSVTIREVEGADPFHGDAPIPIVALASGELAILQHSEHRHVGILAKSDDTILLRRLSIASQEVQHEPSSREWLRAFSQDLTEGPLYLLAALLGLH